MTLIGEESYHTIMPLSQKGIKRATQAFCVNLRSLVSAEAHLSFIRQLRTSSHTKQALLFAQSIQPLLKLEHVYH
jgi:hypothetical protein